MYANTRFCLPSSIDPKSDDMYPCGVEPALATKFELSSISGSGVEDASNRKTRLPWLAERISRVEVTRPLLLLLDDNFLLTTAPTLAKCRPRTPFPHIVSTKTSTMSSNDDKTMVK
jgi:hypothetical protein